jgi:hypothetical protein
MRSLPRSTVVAGIAAIASAAWFPLALLILWALAIGIWLLVTRPVTSAAQATA